MVAANSLATNYRLALEALRSGVPNREAVRVLGCSQPQAVEKFTEMLNGAEPESDSRAPSGSHAGMLVAGDFGAGKSHLLTHFQNQALARGFACSKVVISKETPLYDLGKVFVSAVENGQVQERGGRLIEELAQTLKPDSDSYAAFFRWANAAADNGALHPMFPASLIVHERAGDLDLNVKIESFWAGDRLGVRDLRGGLRSIGQDRNFKFRAPRVADLPPQRLRFLIELIKAAGYKGWVILIDEIELVGSYSILQRGRSYAETARWMGQAAYESYPGLVAVGAVTDDFASANISPDGARKDRDYIRPRLENNARYAGLAPLAETGMRLLERGFISLSPPTDEDVKDVLERLRRLYSLAYGWDAPALSDDASGAGFRGRMRYKVRAAINQWDLRRLNLGDPETVGSEYRHGYEEDPALERKAEEGD